MTGRVRADQEKENLSPVLIDRSKINPICSDMSLYVGTKICTLEENAQGRSLY